MQKEFCGECSLALMHFVGKVGGVESVSADDGRVVIDFDDLKIREEEVVRLARETIETMGYRVSDEK